MPSRSRRARPGFGRAATATRPAKRGLSRWTLPVAGLLVAAAAAVGAFVLLQDRGGDGGAVAWARLDTADVHSLAFDPADASHLYFGHHGGLLESRDGGRSWQPTALSGADAMNVRVGDESLMQIAGHDVYLESRDSGHTWEPVPNDLPGLDLHAFVTDPADPSHAWAYAVGHGLFESSDAGRHWELRLAGDIGALTIYADGGQPVLVGVTQAGVGRSTDGGQTWQPMGRPTGQLASLAASADGSFLYAGTTDGLQRSTDGGQTWSATALSNVAVTIAVAPGDADTVAVVDDQTRFYRSSDGGSTWPGPG
jgi:photosystem II stability/assembly factor-like uncharacterized protein